MSSSEPLPPTPAPWKSDVAAGTSLCRVKLSASPFGWPPPPRFPRKGRGLLGGGGLAAILGGAGAGALAGALARAGGGSRRRRRDRRRAGVDFEDPEAEDAVGDLQVVVERVEQRARRLE